MADKQKPSTEDYTTNIQRYERDPIVVGVIGNNCTFRGQVEEFYDLSTELTWYGRTPAPTREFNFKKENPSKIGQTPSNLIEILSKFSEEDIDAGKLSYLDVRKDYKTFTKWWPRRVLRAVVGPGSLIGILAGVTLSYSGDLEKGLPILGVSIPPHIWALFYSPNSKQCSGAISEYIKLHESAEQADSFMNNHYRDYFIRKQLQFI